MLFMASLIPYYCDLQCMHFKASLRLIYVHAFYVYDKGYKDFSKMKNDKNY